MDPKMRAILAASFSQIRLYLIREEVRNMKAMVRQLA